MDLSSSVLLGTVPAPSVLLMVEEDPTEVDNDLILKGVGAITQILIKLDLYYGLSSKNTELAYHGGISLC